MERTKIWFLENFSILKVLTPEEKRLMHKVTTMKDVPKNQVLYFPEDSSECVFLLKKGKIKISKISKDGREVILAILGPGEVFGELCLTGQTKREEIAEVTDDAVICKVGINDFQKIMGLNANFNLEVTKLIGFKLKKIQNRLENIVFNTSEQRIRNFIKEAVNAFGRQVKGDSEQFVVELGITHEEVAKLTVTSRQTVTTVFRELEKNGIIKYDRKRIYVRNMSAI